MKLVQQTTDDLNGMHIPVLVVNKPLYDIAKKIQWTFHERFEEDVFMVLFGGLHV